MRIVLNGKILDVNEENLGGYFTFDEAQEAAKRWGKRLMTQKEYIALSECKHWWNEDRKGMVFRVSTEDGGFTEIFLPALGYRDPNGVVRFVGEDGGYWSSSPQDDSDGHFMYLNENGIDWDDTSRKFEFSVRPVKDIE